MIEVKKVGTASIPAIRSLAYTTWPVAYKEILPAQQLSYMLELIYNEAALQKQIEEKNHQFIIAFTEKENAGFASYSIKSDAAPGIYRLHKIYIHPGQQGKGIGKLLLDYILQDIKPKGATDLELNVNRDNKALHFYQKPGFVIIKEEDINIGNGYFMNDYVMNLPL